MKIFAILLIIILLSVSLAGCVQKKPEELILGRWEEENDAVSEFQPIYEFYTDGTFIYYFNEHERLVGNYVFMDDYQFRVQFTTQGIKYIDEIMVLKINSISEDKMVLEILDTDNIATFKRM